MSDNVTENNNPVSAEESLWIVAELSNNSNLLSPDSLSEAQQQYLSNGLQLAGNNVSSILPDSLPIDSSSLTNGLQSIGDAVGSILPDDFPIDPSSAIMDQLPRGSSAPFSEQEVLWNLAQLCRDPNFTDQFDNLASSVNLPSFDTGSLGGVNVNNLVSPGGFNISNALSSPNPTDEQIGQILALQSRVSSNPCPPGNICDGFWQFPCERIQLLAIDSIGDLFAGIYCPGNATQRANVQFENCERGYFCPDPTSKTICPAGYYCPYKTATPAIICPGCAEGSQSLVRRNVEFILVIFVPLLVLLVIIFWLIKRKQRRTQEKKDALEQAQKTPVMESEQKELQDKLQRLLPRLKLIQARLRKHIASMEQRQQEQQEQAPASSAGTTTRKMPTGSVSSRFGLSISRHESQSENNETTTQNVIDYDPQKLFDAIDDNKDGDLTYEELNSILDLTPLQLHEFLRRMNFLAGVRDSKRVTKEVFNKYFIRVLEETSHFAPTQEEVGALFDKIVLQHGYETAGEILLTRLYESPIAEFLSDYQIHGIIKGFESVLESSHSFKKSKIRQRRESFAFEIKTTIDKAHFMEHYPIILIRVTNSNQDNPEVMMDEFDEEKMDPSERTKDGIDMAFNDFCLTVGAGNKCFNVVDHVTGRLVSGTMTALMGGSGAGKTSLLNALCGRAYYGTTSGKIEINGNISSIEENAGSVGFVPQDDIVYAELTVKENLMFAGQFALPRGTTRAEVRDLADATMAGLGLTRLAKSIVGDVNRRGVSGGEKKRVNIGLELMSRPKILFLDEPTSGLDSSSALLVMSSLKSLVEKDGVTICSVIHQPRKDIFDLFDRVVLLGEGGKVVYHGLVSGIESYFTSIHYELPLGESLADWMIDISSGRSAPTVQDDLDGIDVLNKDRQAGEVGVDGLSGRQLAKARDLAKLRKFILCERWKIYFGGLKGPEKMPYMAPQPAYLLPERKEKPSFFFALRINLKRHLLVLRRNWFSVFIGTFILVFAVIIISALKGSVQPTMEHIMDIRMQDMLALWETLTSEDGLGDDFPPAVVNFVEEVTEFSRSAFRQHIGYANSLGVLIAVLIGLNATEIITGKRLEFFREASSGYSINAYFLSVNIISTIRHTIDVTIGALFAVWLHNTISNGVYYFVNFIMLGWVSVSWALLFAVTVSPKNVTIVVGFYMMFLSIMFGGSQPPVNYENIYASPILQILTGFFSPTRFFVESLAVSESRCLPPQTAFTYLAHNTPRMLYIFEQAKVAQNDFSTAIQQSCNGWYWGMLPSFFVGLTIRVVALGAMHACNRGQQGKKPLLQDMMAELRSSKYQLFCSVVGYILLLLGLIAITCYLILRK